MIERYTLPEMGQIWTEQTKLEMWLKVEIAVCQAQAACGLIPAEALAEIESKARFDRQRVQEIEQQVRHDVIAFLTNVNEFVGEAGRYIHLGLTSSDVLDTGLSLQLVAATDLLLGSLDDLLQIMGTLAQRHRQTVMIGRTHGIHAEPITFGLKVAGWLAEFRRHRQRLAQVRSEIAVGKISGAVGTYAHISPEVEQRTCVALGLHVDPVSTQVISRDRHALYVQSLALIGASIERVAVEIRHLQRTDVLEAEEYFAAGQKGSSAMPHKRNPIRCEQLSGLARLLRSYSIAALENIPLWHERDISHSSVERVILPDSSIIAHYMLVQLRDILATLQVYPENMQRNMQRYGGVVFSQQVLLALVHKGLTREEAYALVQRHAHAAWNQPDGDFRASLAQDPQIQALLTPAELDACFDPRPHLRHVDTILARLGL
ncbi:MAG: adenylosuccinate lyase [Thermostichales cyanobacterium BF4_bins_65]